MWAPFLVKSAKKQPGDVENACEWPFDPEALSCAPQRHFTGPGDHW
jgi:hypothetical protein